jgi:hypothetical protein
VRNERGIRTLRRENKSLTRPKRAEAARGTRIAPIRGPARRASARGACRRTRVRYCDRAQKLAAGAAFSVWAVERARAAGSHYRGLAPFEVNPNGLFSVVVSGGRGSNPRSGATNERTEG